MKTIWKSREQGEDEESDEPTGTHYCSVAIAPVPHSHGPSSSCSHLHRPVVHACEVPEEIDIAAEEDQRVQKLRLEGDACTASTHADSDEQTETEGVQ